MKKFTNEEIIKALECHTHGKESNLNCCDCDYIQFQDCSQRMSCDALDLINRQQAEIERLQRLFEQEEKSKNSLTKKCYKDGIEEFADKLIKKLVNTPFVVNCTGETSDYKEGCLRGLVAKQNNIIDEINNIKKELVGDNNARKSLQS